jgi:phosphate transport system permease protein
VDALRALPDGLREASLALGATRWQTIRRTLVPAGASGIFTGVILGTGRAIGETLAVSFIVGGNSNSWPLRIDNIYPYVHLLPTNVISVVLLFDFGDANNPSLTYSTLWTLAFVLLLISFVLVAISRFIASRSVYNQKDQRPSRRQIARAVARTPGAELRSVAR